MFRGAEPTGTPHRRDRGFVPPTAARGDIYIIGTHGILLYLQGGNRGLDPIKKAHHRRRFSEDNVTPCKIVVPLSVPSLRSASTVSVFKKPPARPTPTRNSTQSLLSAAGTTPTHPHASRFPAWDFSVFNVIRRRFARQFFSRLGLFFDRG